MKNPTPSASANRDALLCLFREGIRSYQANPDWTQYGDALYPVYQYVDKMEHGKSASMLLNATDIVRFSEIYHECMKPLAIKEQYIFVEAFLDSVHMLCLSYPGISRTLRAADHVGMLLMLVFRYVNRHWDNSEVIPFKSQKAPITPKQDVSLSLDSFERNLGRVSNLDTVIALIKELYAKEGNVRGGRFGRLCMNNGICYDMAFLKPDEALKYYHDIYDISSEVNDDKNGLGTLKRMVCLQSRSLDSWVNNMHRISQYIDYDMLPMVYHMNDITESIPFDMVVDSCTPREPDDKDYETVIRYVNVFNDGLNNSHIRINMSILGAMLAASIIANDAPAVPYIYASLLMFLNRYHHEMKGSKLVDKVFLIRSVDFDKELLMYITTMPFDFSKETFTEKMKNINMV